MSLDSNPGLYNHKTSFREVEDEHNSSVSNRTSLFLENKTLFFKQIEQLVIPHLTNKIDSIIIALRKFLLKTKCFSKAGSRKNVVCF